MADPFHKFTERARRVLALAQEEAQRLGHNYIGTEHFLLGLVREGDGIAARVLDTFGVQLPKVRSAVELIIRRGAAMPPGEIGLTPRAKQVIELSIDEARRLNHHFIGTEHLLLGLIREGESIAAGVLEGMGVSLERTRAEVIRIIEFGGAVAPLPPEAPFLLPVPGSPGRGADLPRLTDLLRVVPIAQRQEHGGVTALLLALELYADGFVVTMQLQSTSAATGRGFPELPFAAADDRGNTYRGLLHGGSGGGGPDLHQWRTARHYTPALDHAARELRLHADALHWRGHDPAGRRMAPSNAIPGPWTCTIVLPAGHSGTDEVGRS